MQNPVQKRLAVMGLFLVLILCAGTIGFNQLEDFSAVDALYFTVVTVATVGYGDLHPTTPAGRMLAVAIILFGVGTFLFVVANGTELIMERRQAEARRERLNMVMGLFFAEIGFDLLRYFANADTLCNDTRSSFNIGSEWTDKDFSRAEKAVADLCMKIDYATLDKEGVKRFLAEKSDLLLRILENENLQEHGEFTDLIRAVFHLKAELVERKGFEVLPPSDLRHLAGDAERAYRPLAKAWVNHMRYLKNGYPYLYSLAVRTNPFNPAASAVVVD